MSKQKIRTLRLRKQEISLDKQPLQNAFVKRIQDLKFYFCLYNLEDDFKDGFYFGLLELHPQYPFAAPKLFVYTPNGRYEPNLAICTSFTNYHQQSWTSAWNVRTLIQATISFMYANEPSYGCRHDPSQVRKKYARQSLDWNMKNELFVKLFGQKVKQKLSDLNKKNTVEENKKLLEANQSEKIPLQEHINERVDRRNRLQNINQLEDRLIDVPEGNRNQQNDNERRWYKKKRMIVVGVAVLSAVGIGVKFCFLNK